MSEQFIIFLLIVVSFVCYYCPIDANNICYHMRNSKTKPIFDFAYTLRTAFHFEHNLYCNQHEWRILNYSTESLVIDKNGLRPQSILYTAFKGYNLAFSLYKVKGNDTLYRDFVCYYLNESVNFRRITEFECDSKFTGLYDYKLSCQIDIESTVAYILHSYNDSDITRQMVLLVQRKQRSVWKTDWLNVLPNVVPWFKVQVVPCVKVENNDQSIPQFLYAIDHSLQITGIIGIPVHKAIVLFFHNERHKFCITNEQQLSEDCKPENLRNYLNQCYRNRIDWNEQTSTSISNNVSSTTMFNKSKSFWFVIAIIAVVLVIAVIIIGICFLIYSVYRSKTKSQNGKTNDGNDKDINDTADVSQQQQIVEQSDQTSDSTDQPIKSTDQKDESNIEKNIL